MAMEAPGGQVKKQYVGVLAMFTPEGAMRPVTVVWPDGRQFKIERMIRAQRAASLKAGGAGMRYECTIQGKPRYIFYEDGNGSLKRKSARMGQGPRP